jgi:hypothetical protein
MYAHAQAFFGLRNKQSLVINRQKYAKFGLNFRIVPVDISPLCGLQCPTGPRVRGWLRLSILLTNHKAHGTV